MLKKTSAALTLALVVGTASSAFAASGYSADRSASVRSGFGAFAQAAPSQQAWQNGASFQAVVSTDGRIIGRDPDVNVREQVQRDYETLAQ